MSVLSDADAPSVTINQPTVTEGQDIVIEAELTGGTYDTLEYQWTNDEGSLSDSEVQDTIFTPPAADTSVTLTIKITARGTGTNAADETSDTSTASVTFTVGDESTEAATILQATGYLDPYITPEANTNKPYFIDNLQLTRAGRIITVEWDAPSPPADETWPAPDHYRVTVGRRDGKDAPYILLIRAQQTSPYKYTLPDNGGNLVFAVQAVNVVSEENYYSDAKVATITFGDKVFVPNYTYHVDWDNDGLYNHKHSDISQYVSRVRYEDGFNGEQIRGITQGRMIVDLNTQLFNFGNLLYAIRYWGKKIQVRKDGVEVYTAKIIDIERGEENSPEDLPSIQAQTEISFISQSMRTELLSGITNIASLESLLSATSYNERLFKYGNTTPFVSYIGSGNLISEIEKIAFNSGTSENKIVGAITTPAGNIALISQASYNSSLLDIDVERRYTIDEIDSITNRIVIMSIGEARPAASTTAKIGDFTHIGYDLFTPPTVTAGKWTRSALWNKDSNKADSTYDTIGTLAGDFISLGITQAVYNAIGATSVLVIGNKRFAISGKKFITTAEGSFGFPSGAIFFGRWIDGEETETSQIEIHEETYSTRRQIVDTPSTKVWQADYFGGTHTCKWYTDDNTGQDQNYSLYIPNNHPNPPSAEFLSSFDLWGNVQKNISNLKKYRLYTAFLNGNYVRPVNFYADYPPSVPSGMQLHDLGFSDGFPVYISIPIEPPTQAAGDWMLDSFTLELSQNKSNFNYITSEYSPTPHSNSLLPVDSSITGDGYMIVKMNGYNYTGFNGTVKIRNVNAYGIPLTVKQGEIFDANSVENKDSIKEYGLHSKEILFFTQLSERRDYAQSIIDEEPKSNIVIMGTITNSKESQLLYHWPLDVVEFDGIEYTIEHRRIEHIDTLIRFTFLLRPL